MKPSNGARRALVEGIETLLARIKVERLLWSPGSSAMYSPTHGEILWDVIASEGGPTVLRDVRLLLDRHLRQSMLPLKDPP